MVYHHDILKQIANGDKLAIKQLYDLYISKVYNIVLSYTQNKEDAEEVTQDVFVKIVRNADKFNGQSQVGTWVYRICVNTALNYIKARKRRSFLSFGSDEVDRPDFVHPGVLLENKEKSVMLFKAIGTLPETQKTAFILSYVEDLPRQEVAEIMGTTLKAVESLLQRGKAQLRSTLKDQIK